jgi:hypothetical protein
LADRTGKTAEAIARRIQKLAGPLRTDIDWRIPLKLWTKVKRGGLDPVHDSEGAGVERGRGEPAASGG